MLGGDLLNISCKMIPNKQQSECSFQLEPSSPVFLDEIVKKCDLGFQIGKHFLQICSSFERLQCETKSVIEVIFFEFKRRALLSRKQTELSVSTHFQLWKTKTILWFQRRWMAVLWSDINQLLEVGPNDCITSARRMTVTNLSTIRPKTRSRRFLLKLLG